MDITVFLLLFFALPLIIYVFVASRRGHKNSNRQAKTHIARESKHDEQALRENELGYSPEEMELLKKKVQAFLGTKHITREGMRRYILHSISEDFAEMPGWCSWDESIHNVAGQYERYERAVKEKLTVLAYDPIYKLAKVRGSNFDTYLTSCNRCSCPDFRERKLPCKHMYSLCMFLDGDVEKSLFDVAHKPLNGLRFALAGRFHGGRDDPYGIRGQINSLGGVWSDDIQKASHALVGGNGISAAKRQRAESADMEIFTADDIMALFQAAQE